jgi:excisionase family DNA binding protein
MQIELPDDLLLDALREAFMPAIERLIDERVQQRRPLLLSITQVADELSCSRASVYGLIHGGYHEAIRTGRTYRVATSTLQEYVEELAKPTQERAVVSARSKPTTATRPSPNVNRRRPRQPPPPSVLAADKPPRSPRQKQHKMSKQEIANERCTISKFADRWWGAESAVALMERSGVALTEGEDGQTTFRYGDLIEWMENNNAAFQQWAEEFDPVLNPRRRDSELGNRPTELSDDFRCAD